MNYLKQLLAFYDGLELNQLNSSEIALWQALMFTNNKSVWSDTFTVASSVLCQRAGLKKANFFKTRNTLAQKGYIIWDPTGSNKAARYQIKVLYNSLSTNSVDTSIRSSRDRDIRSSRDSGRALNKQKLKTNKIKTNNHDDQPDSWLKQLFEIYSQEIGVIGPTAKQLVFDSIKDFTDQGTKEDEASQIVIHAIKIMAENNAKSWKYVQAILNNWLSHSLFSLDNIKAYQAKSRKPKQKYGKYNQKPKETGTDWSKVKAKETSNSSNDLQDRLAKIRGKQDATS